MGKRVQKLLIYIFIRVSRDVVVPPLRLSLSLVPRLPPRNYFPCECEFKGHAIIARARGGRGGAGERGYISGGGQVNITCVQYLLIQQFYAIHFSIHLVLPVVCDRESFLVVCECRDSDQS